MLALRMYRCSPRYLCVDLCGSEAHNAKQQLPISQCDTTSWRCHGAGAIQRFSVGFRGPLCLVCGFTGVPATTFALGAAIGALGTMPIQLTVVGVCCDHANNLAGSDSHACGDSSAFVQLPALP